mmetsp:Transcript_30811/g.30324  ORF Transcript_30811/g.30324 Transcript_30811/m.30324 type:complete len:121 (-) Transcript_30811:39-401(-)
MVEGKFYMPPLAVQQVPNSLFNDVDDKIIIFHYGSVTDIYPDILVLYLMGENEGKIAELHYDKANSDISSYEKKDVVFDALSKRIVTFTALDPQVFDYISLHDDFFNWKQGKFLTHLFHH